MITLQLAGLLGSIQSYPDTLLVPSRHLSDTVKSIYVCVVKGTSRKWNCSWKKLKWLYNYNQLSWQLQPFLERWEIPTHALYNANVDRVGVWKVSERCLEVARVTLNTAWRVIMPNKLAKLCWRNIEYCLAGSFSINNPGVSVGCLADVWEVS